MKKISLIIFVIISLLVLSSCAKKEVTDVMTNGAFTEEVKEEKYVTVAILVSGRENPILPETKVSFKENETAFDVLKRITQEKGIQMEFSGSGQGIYVEGIDNLYDFDLGPNSGWIFRINDKMAETGVAAVVLNENDTIEWKYTLDFMEEF